MQDLIRDIIARIGEDPEREGLRKTPERVERALRYFTEGYRIDINELIKGALFEEPFDEIVAVTHINFFSLCEHHLLPFFGLCHVGYIPKGKLIGLSKIPRVVDMFARRLQLQERMTTQIAGCLQEVLQPRGVAVVTIAEHMCLSERGVEKRGAKTVASAMLGGFRTNPQTRMEFLEIIKMKEA
jgi:GTP cyclohydrolase I